MREVWVVSADPSIDFAMVFAVIMVTCLISLAALQMCSNISTLGK